MIKLKSLLQEQTAVYKNGMKDSQVGTKNGPIAKIQQKLIDAGAMKTIPDAQYGIYGPKTAAAVTQFQTNNKLKVDGIVGPDTMSALNKIASTSNKSNNSTTSNTTPSSTASEIANKLIKATESYINDAPAIQEAVFSIKNQQTYDEVNKLLYNTKKYTDLVHFIESELGIFDRERRTKLLNYLKTIVKTPDTRLTSINLKTPQKQDQQTMNKITSKEPESDEGWFQYIRKGFPNIVQLFNGKPLTTADFTTDQQKILLNVIQQSAKRLNRTNSGSTKYIDYGQEVASKFQNEKGSPSTWAAAWGAITFDMKFAMATLLGKFDWNKNSDGTYTITDKYDFKDPKYAAISGINRESLEGKSVPELEDEYDLSFYEAARVKGWVDHPDSIPEKALSVNLTIDPNTLT